MSTEKSNRVNRQITAKQVRLIDAEGKQLGVVEFSDALQKAEATNLDLVEISPQAEPPVCRIMDYGKHLFQQSKKKTIARKKQKVTHIKELKFRPAIEEGDYQVKLRKLTQFIEAEDKVKVTVRFRGREVTHHELGFKVLERLQQDIQELALVEQAPKFEGRQVVMVVAPKKK